MSIAASGRKPLAVAVGTVGCMEPIVTQGLTKRYGELFAVRELDLTVRAGEVYGFLGPNGAGKTTTLRMLLGLVRPTAGRVLLHGRPPGSLDGVGALIEGPAFYPYLSGRDNLRVLARHAAVPGKRVDVVLDLVDLPARAGMADMRAMIRRLGAAGCTVMVSSHLLGEVEQICDRVGVISRGRLVSEGTVADMRGAAELRVVAAPLDRAAGHARALLGPGAVSLVDGGLHLAVAADRAGEINASLVSAGVTVTELRIVERDLEEAFFELTGGEAHVG